MNITSKIHSITDTEDPPWLSYKEEDGHQRYEFMLFCMRLAK